MAHPHPSLLAILALGLASTNLLAQPTAIEGEMSRFQGKWRITELVDNGRAIPPEQFAELLPSGGRVEIIDNAMVFTTAVDGKKSAKSFSIDPTTYPKSLAIINHNAVESVGIYKFDSERLVVCIANPLVSVRPEDFSAHAGSKRIMMVVQRYDGVQADKQVASVLPPPPRQTPAPAPASVPVAVAVAAVPASISVPSALPPPPASSAAARILSDADVTTMLVGTWRLNDSTGLVDVTFRANRTFQSYRETQNLSTFHNVFVQSPVGSGTWSVNQGQLTIHITASTRLDRVNQNVVFAVRSISAKDLIFVDQLGRVGTAVKLN